ncbi:MAG TPA: ArdC-like ssDNA-binding domain-containing protein [Fimbriimonas sp.]|nr:ArdC-like ssDNA-binding domain-containing protein [Fimbriimonas sp.]
MQAETACKLVTDQLDTLSNALASGQSEQLQNYLSAMAKFHRYSVSNVFLILLQSPDATHVAGYHTWRTLGRHVKEGERGIAIIAPMRMAAKDEGQQHGDKDQESHIRFRTAYVFDISQTDGEPLPDIGQPGGDPGDFSERLRGLVKQMSIELEYADDLGGALGVSKGGKIAIKSDLSPAQEFSVLVHELAHEILHHKKNEERPSKTLRETQAEAVAYIVGQGIGLDTGDASKNYIQLYQGDAKSLMASLEEVRQCATEILSALLADE